MRIHIRLAPLNPDLPSLNEARARRDLLPRLAEWIDFDDAWGSEGELWLELDEEGDALPLVEQVLAELGLEETASVEID